MRRFIIGAILVATSVLCQAQSGSDKVVTSGGGVQDLTWDAATQTLSITNAQGTQIDIMSGATSGADGEAGLVPKPLAGEEGLFLKGDGTWANPTTGGDNWGSQVAQTSGYVGGNGTSGNRIRLIQNGAADGNVIAWDNGLGGWDARPQLDSQAISLNVNSLEIERGGSVDLSGYLDNTDTQDLSLVGSTLSLTDGGSVDLSTLQDGTGTDDQTLSLVSNTLSIEDGNSVDLSGYLDNTDSQTLSLVSDDLSISGGNSVDLSAYLDNTDTQDLSLAGSILSLTDGGSVDLSAIGGGDPDQSLSFVGTTLSISGGNSVNLSSLLDNTDTQDLSLAGSVISLTDGGSIDIQDASATNEIQAITVDFSGNFLTFGLSQANTTNVNLYTDGLVTGGGAQLNPLSVDTTTYLATQYDLTQISVAATANNGLSIDGGTGEVILGGSMNQKAVIEMQNQAIEFNADNNGGTDYDAITDSIFVRFVDGRGQAYGFAVSDGSQPGYFVIDDIVNSDFGNMIQYNEVDLIDVGTSTDKLQLSASELYFFSGASLDTMPAGSVDFLLGYDETTRRWGPTTQLSTTGSGGGSGGDSFYTEDGTFDESRTVSGDDYNLVFDQVESLEINDVGNNVGLRIINDVDLGSGKALHTLLAFTNTEDSIRWIQEAINFDTTKFIAQINTAYEIEVDELEVESYNTNFDVGRKDEPGIWMDNGSFAAADDAITNTVVMSGSGSGTSDYDIDRGGYGDFTIPTDAAVSFTFDCITVVVDDTGTNMEVGDAKQETGRGAILNIGGLVVMEGWTYIQGGAIIEDSDMSDAGLNITANTGQKTLDVSYTPAQSNGGAGADYQTVCRFEYVVNDF